ncbi:5-methylcytosine-specific restriction endonuclease McrBC regulatory subunit McrC [Xanthomonas arboricola]
MQLDRNMRTYREVPDWARLAFQGLSPKFSAGSYQAPSLLFPTEKLLETYVAKHFKKQLPAHLVLGTQVKRHHLVRHGDAQWFQLRPTW